MATGRCIAESEILYVDREASSTSANCIRTQPCRSIGEAVAAAAGTRTWIHVMGSAGAYSEAISLASQSLKLIGRERGQDPVTLRPPSGVSAVSVTATGELSLENVRITGAMGTGAYGIRCIGVAGRSAVVRLARSSIELGADDGVSADKCRIAITRSRIVQNAGHGVVALDSEVAIEDSESVDNGRDGVRVVQNSSLTMTNVKLARNALSALSAQEASARIRGGEMSQCTAGIYTTTADVVVEQASIFQNQRFGVFMNLASSLRMSRSRVFANGEGGIVVDGSKIVVGNSFFYDNGTSLSDYGGIAILRDPPGGQARLEFNTITANQSKTTKAAGVQCVDVSTTLVFTNNIIYGNGSGVQVSGCAHAYSNIGPTPAVGGTGNINQDPKFVDPVGKNFHIQPTSPCRDAADPAATLGEDFDGEPRPLPAGAARRDIGADEVP